MDEARRYLRASHALREALSIPRDSSLEAIPLGNGEHNANFAFDHPATGARYVLRMNYASQLGLREQSSYEHGALRALAASGRTPSAVYVDETRSVVDRGVQVIGFCPGRLLDLERDDDLSKAAKSLADIHSVAVPDECALLRPRNPLAEIRDESLRMYQVYAGSKFVDAHVAREIEGLLATCDRVVEAHDGGPMRSHIVNTECIAAHFLIPEAGDFAYVVDWEKPIVGDAAQDVAFFVAPTTTFWDSDIVFDDARRDMFVRAYIDSVEGRFPTEGFVERFFAYLTLTCLRGVTWCAMAQVEYHDPKRPLKNDKTFRKIQAYLSDDFFARLKRQTFLKRFA